MLKISACSENCKKACWKFQHVLKTATHFEKVCLKFQHMLKIVMHVQNYVENFRVCWKFQGMLKTVICVENYVETACWKFQPVLKNVMHVESYVKISRCVENAYVRHIENHIENCVEVRKKHHHTLRHVLKLSGRFRFLVQFYTRNWSETYIFLVTFSFCFHLGYASLLQIHVKTIQFSSGYVLF